MKINLYDFDNTIYEGDSSVDFFFYMLKNKKVKISNLFDMLINFILWKLKIRKKEDFKESFFKIVRNTNDIDSDIIDFWNKHEHNIKKFYLDTNHNDDVIISASPEFLLEPICEKLKVKKLIASPIDKHTGLYNGINCYNKEKVRRLNEVYSDYDVMSAYSDSMSDKPILDLAKTAYIVKHDKLIPYKNGE